MTQEEHDDQKKLSRARAVGHEVKNHLFVVGMGLETLKTARPNEEQFRELLEMVRQNGLEPLKASIEELISLIDGE
ncbi:hypothetical protein [Rubinisphaera margarita]|uniref:hypothetical protein n=1 Tax=Rubinisphaera margarita TaxID=2909586 RepID=UPI001EE91BDA|nr:hypothetical protein [Rubinisphaera margarita]MCG6158298.1 hypothetical protein [Rubinisphaera margarita]